MAEGQGTLNRVITIYNPEVLVHPFCIYDIHTVHSLKSKCANTSGFILVLSFCICIKTETYHIYCFSMQTSQLKHHKISQISNGNIYLNGVHNTCIQFRLFMESCIKSQRGNGILNHIKMMWQYMYIEQ